MMMMMIDGADDADNVILTRIICCRKNSVEREGEREREESAVSPDDQKENCGHIFLFFSRPIFTPSSIFFVHSRAGASDASPGDVLP